MDKPQSIDDLKSAPYNPRSISPEAIEGLKASLHEFGDISGLVWNARTGHLVTGHQRLRALKEKHGAESLRLQDGAVVTPTGERFPVRVVDWPEAKEKAANVAANSGLLMGDFTPELTAVLDEVRASLPELAAPLRLEELYSHSYQRGKRAMRKRGSEGEKADLGEALALSEEEKARFGKYKVAVVDFSGGRDSSAAALWACANFPRTVLLYVLLADFPGFPLHVCKVAETLGAELRMLDCGAAFWQTLEERGWPSRFGPWCQDLMHEALAREVRNIGGPEEVIRITGSRRGQAKASSEKTATTPLPSTPEYAHYAPMFNLGDKALRDLLAEHSIPLWPGYTKGFNRTSCWCCPGQRPAAYLALRREYPGLFATLLEMERCFGRGWWQPKVRQAGLKKVVEGEG